MNLKCIYKVMIILIPVMLLSSANLLHGKEAEWAIVPYLDGYTSIENGYLELGPELKIKDNDGFDKWIIRPSLRFLITDKKNETVDLSRDTSYYAAILSIDRIADVTSGDGPILRFRYGLQGEWWTKKFSYFPDGNKENKTSEWKHSFAIELRGFLYSTDGKSFSTQVAPQFRLRYSRIWKEASKTGIVVPSQTGGPDTIANMIINPPGTRPILNLAFAMPYYPGGKRFWITPALHYTFTGKVNKHNPFKNSSRLRFEAWLFYSQWDGKKGASKIRIGIAPYLSYRTHGTDPHARMLYGAFLQVKYGGNFLKFL